MPAPSSITSQSLPDVDQAIDDEELATWLNARHAAAMTVAYAHAKYLCKVFEVGTASTGMILANPGKSSLAEFKRIAKSRKLKRVELQLDEFEQSVALNPIWDLFDATADEVGDWHKARERLFGQGRGKAISPTTAALVWHTAGGRCMYRGCGQDLGQTPLTTKAARIAYLAHIVSSDPDGPRGNDDSHDLSDDPENIMLMCDAHHRLIDRIDEAGHNVERLRVMRDEHARRVNYLLDGIAYPSTLIVTLLADLAQVSTNVSQTELRESVLSRHLGPLCNPINAIRRTQRDDRGRQDFWWHFLHEHENDIRTFILQTSNQPSRGNEVAPDVLAIFPLHLVPLLFVAGRIVGEARPVEVFQYDRDRRTWRWDETATPSAPGSISITTLPSDPIDELVLSIELTAAVEQDNLPTVLSSAVRNQVMPWIRITHLSPNYNCIRTPDDLSEFTQVARQAIRVIQDQLRAKRVHLIGVAPASTLFRFGQLLQAGHHPLYQLYDRPDGGHQFVPALTIDGTEIVANSFNGTQPFKISLR